MTWREELQQLQAAAAHARTHREPPRPGFRVALWASLALYLVVVGAAAWELRGMERVPIHFGVDGAPDGWATPRGALALSLLMPLLVLWLPLLSRLAISFPSGINLNAGDKAWWMATGPRLARFERLLREQLLACVAAILLLVFVPVEALTWWVGAGGSPSNGAGPTPFITPLFITPLFVTLMVVFVTAMIWWTVHLTRLFRRRPADLA